MTDIGVKTVGTRRQETDVGLGCGGEGFRGVGRMTGRVEEAERQKERGVMYFCTRLPKPNSYRSHQLSPEIPTPLAPAGAS